MRSTASQPSDDERRRFEAEALPHLDALYRYASHLSGDATLAEDLTQETLWKAYRAWHQFRPGSNVRAWLLTILRNTFINQYRRRQHQGETVDIAEIEPYAVFREVQDVDPEARFFDNLVDHEVTQAIDALPPEFREVLLLSDAEDLSYAEIGEILGVPVGTVKSRLFRARRALQERLYRYAADAGYIKRRTP